MKRKLELDVASFQIALENAKKQLRTAKQSMDSTARIQAQLDINAYSRNLTEAKRQLNNYVNTGDKDLSRLQAKFNSVNDTFKKQ